MSSINSVGSALSTLLSSTSNDEGASSTSATSSTGTSGTSSTSGTDTVELSTKARETLFDCLKDDESTDRSNLLDVLKSSNDSDDSGNSMYDLLSSAMNAKLVQDNPALVNMILTVKGAESSETSSSSLTDSDLAAAESIDLLNMSASSLVSIVKKYNSLSSTSSSEVDETA